MKKRHKQNGGQDQPDTKTLPTYQQSSPPVITVDLVKYVHHLDGLDLTPDQQAELLQTLSNIAWSFIALGFNVHPVQQVDKACGKGSENTDQRPFPDENELSLLGDFIKESAVDFADPETDRTVERVE